MNPKELIDKENYKYFPFNYRNLEIHYLNKELKFDNTVNKNKKLQNEEVRFQSFYKTISRII